MGLSTQSITLISITGPCFVIDKASVGRRNVGEKMVEELRKRLGDSLKVKTSNCEELRLTYFPARGRAEISRLILAHAGVKFDDIRLSGEDFAKVKPLLPYGSMPILEYKGEVICESMAIAKFLAELCNVAGTTILEKAKAEEVVLAMNGVFESVAKCLFAPEGEKAGLKKKLIEETLPQKFGQLEGRLCLNGGQFFSGNALTFADIMLVVLQDNLRSNVIGAGDLIEKFPKMCNLFQRVTALPNIKAWRGSRPIDPMFNN